MWFNLLLGNHGDGPQLLGISSLVEHLRMALGECGHSLTVSHNEMMATAVNLFVEHFLDGETVVRQFQHWRKTAPIGVIASELMIKGMIPYAQHGILQPPSDIAARIAGFDAVIQEVDFLWCMLERTQKEYQQRAPFVAHLPIGYLAVPQAQRCAPKDIDIVFFGKSTPHRVRMLAALQQAGLRVVVVGRGFPMGWQADFVTRSYLDRACIGLNLTLHGEEESSVAGIDPRFVSCTRVPEMLSRQICVVSEEIPLDNPYYPYMVNAPLDRLVDVCQKLIASGDWREHGHFASLLFRQEMSSQRVMGPVVEQTLRHLAKRWPMVRQG